MDTDTPDTEKSVNQKIENAKMSNSQIAKTAQAQNLIKGIGFKSIKGVGDGDYSIVHEDHAKEIFEDMVNHCQSLGKVNQLSLDKMKKRFNAKPKYDFVDGNIPIQISSNKFGLDIIKFTYIKKQSIYFIGYEHFSAQFTLTSDILLKNYGNSSSKSRAYGVQLFTFGIPIWGSYSHSQKSGQTIERRNRGLDNNDMKILLMYQNLINVDRQGMLEVFQTMT